MRVHVDDIRADRDVNGARDAGAMGRKHQAAVGMGAGPSSMCRPRAAAEAEIVLGPARAARAKASAVSRAMPNLPSCSVAPTSSLVLPATASSKSWMAAEPFIATALISPL